MDDLSKRTKRKIIVNSLFALVSMLFTLAAGEVVFGILNAHNSKLRLTEQAKAIPDADGRFFRYDPVLGMQGIPFVQKHLLGKTVTQNSRGERGREISVSKNSGTIRIEFLGDSQTWGVGMDDKETIPDFVERILAGRNDHKYEAVNLGAPGYGTDQEYLKLLVDGLRYSPDYIVLVYFPDNDIKEALSDKAWNINKPQFTLKDGNLCLWNFPVPKSVDWPGIHLEDLLNILYGERINLDFSQILKFISHRQVSYQAAENIVKWLGLKDNPFLEDFDQEKQDIKKYISCTNSSAPTGDFSPQDGAILVTTLMLKMKERAEAIGADFVVVMKALKSDLLAGNKSVEYRKVEDGLRQAGVAVLDTFDQIKEKNLPVKNFFWESDHFGAPGNRLIAKMVTQYIFEKNPHPF
jgi:lysophospholipase L1-like esterase